MDDVVGKIVEDRYLEFDKNRKEYEVKEADKEDDLEMKRLEQAEKVTKGIKRTTLK